MYQTNSLLNDFKYYKLTIAHAHTSNEWIFKILDKTNCQSLFLAVRVNEIILLVACSSLHVELHSFWKVIKLKKKKNLWKLSRFFGILIFLCLKEKSKILSWKILCLCMCQWWSIQFLWSISCAFCFPWLVASCLNWFTLSSLGHLTTWYTFCSHLIFHHDYNRL